MGLQEGRVVHDGGEQGGERPQQEGGEELGDDWILETGGEEQTPLKHDGHVGPLSPVEYITASGGWWFLK